MAGGGGGGLVGGAAGGLPKEGYGLVNCRSEATNQ